MPIHDWTRVDAGLFHDFHQSWTFTLRQALNAGCLPPGYFALIEQNIKGPIPDVLTLKLAADAETSDRPDAGGIAVASAPPQSCVVQQTEADLYAHKANRITVRHRHGEVVAVIEIVSPGNKSSQAAFRVLVEKSADLIYQGVHLLVIDLFPPGRRDPHGIHKAIWSEFQDDGFELPPHKPLTLASYSSGPVKTAYVEPLAVGDALPSMPLFLETGTYVSAPLEATYGAAWDAFPAVLKALLA
jgi:hypothetical protein